MKKIKYLLFTLVLSIVCSTSVKAAGACSTGVLYEEQKAVAEMKVTYEEMEEKEYDGEDEFTNHYLAIVIHNVPDNVKMTFEVSTKSDTNKTNVDSSAREENGSIYFVDKLPNELKSYTITVTSSSAECKGESLKTLKLNTPMLNPYAGPTTCEDNPGFKWCHFFVNYDMNTVDEAAYNKALNNYKEEKEEEEAKAKEEKEKEQRKKTNKRIVLVLTLAVILGGLITYNVIKKKKGSKTI